MVSVTSKFVPAEPEQSVLVIALFTMRHHTAEHHHAANLDRGKNHDPGSDEQTRS